MLIISFAPSALIAIALIGVSILFNHEFNKKFGHKNWTIVRKEEK
jgi:hypothetical protein